MRGNSYPQRWKRCGCHTRKTVYRPCGWLLFVVYGGGESIKQWCRDNGAVCVTPDEEEEREREEAGICATAHYSPSHR